MVTGLELVPTWTCCFTGWQCPSLVPFKSGVLLPVVIVLLALVLS